MTVRVERSFEIDASPEEVWVFIADSTNRATAISVVEDWEVDGDETVWHLKLPIPLVKRTIAVRTRDVERVENERVEFVGRSSVMNVTGEHELTKINGRTRIRNEFAVDGKLPGVERFFERNFEDEIENLRIALEQTIHPDS